MLSKRISLALFYAAENLLNLHKCALALLNILFGLLFHIHLFFVTLLKSSLARFPVVNYSCYKAITPKKDAN